MIDMDDVPDAMRRQAFEEYMQAKQMVNHMMQHPEAERMSQMSADIADSLDDVAHAHIKDVAKYAGIGDDNYLREMLELLTISKMFATYVVVSGGADRATASLRAVAMFMIVRRIIDTNCGDRPTTAENMN
jgi:hypothetical protein